jgi:D-tyrosyl-tRNA(Tyr) deacylase
MRALLQRVSRGGVTAGERCLAKIGPGLVILLGIGHGDGEDQARKMVDKIANLRIFEDDQGKMNRSILETHGEALVISQFTLYADTRRGRRPSFIDAALPDAARPLVDRFAGLMVQAGIPTQTGEFAASMQVELVNDGPVTIWLEIPPDLTAV